MIREILFNIIDNSPSDTIITIYTYCGEKYNIPISYNGVLSIYDDYLNIDYSYDNVIIPFSSICHIKVHK